MSLPFLAVMFSPPYRQGHKAEHHSQDKGNKAHHPVLVAAIKPQASTHITLNARKRPLVGIEAVEILVQAHRHDKDKQRKAGSCNKNADRLHDY